MKSVLALAACMGLFTSAALADCAGHNTTAQSKAMTTVATLDLSTTASTTPVEPAAGTVTAEKPADTE